MFVGRFTAFVGEFDVMVGNSTAFVGHFSLMVGNHHVRWTLRRTGWKSPRLFDISTEWLDTLPRSLDSST
ncbi:hypothetical protein MKY15_00440 [Sporosarcina sp. FSL K6-1540]|uniref:hypothetical protein n=1 Tax=Sporosarcina sp. FSL K6-1540 TaxID=2921555 RepID=UPI00315AD199